MRINITTPECVGKLEVMKCGWIYADDNLEVFRLTMDVLGKSHLLVSAETFQRCALDLQAPFVRWVDECMSTVSRRYWLATPLSKNPFESHLFLHLVWLFLVGQIAKQGKNEIIVVTRSHGLAIALGELCLIHSWECKRYGKTGSIFSHWRHNLIALTKWLGKLLLLVYRVAVAKFIFTKEYVATKMATTELLLETYILEGDLGEDNRCKDRYFPGLMAYYQAQGIKAGYFPHLYHISFMHIWKTYSAMKQNEVVFVPFEVFITFRDMALAAWTSMRFGLSFRLQTPLLFQGAPVSSLVRAECFTSGLRGVVPFILACAPRRMAEVGVRPKWFIDWFENQTLDKGVVMGFKEGLPECHTIAVRQYVPLSNFLSLLSSSGEVKAGVAPTENWVCGDALKPILSRFDMVGKYSVVPALRYSYIHQSAPATMVGDVLLVLLTHSMEESMAILDCVTPLCREKGIGVSRLIIKTHPAMNFMQFRQKAELRFPSLRMNGIEWADVKIDELFPLAKVVVTSGSSSAVEAICRGIPVVLVGRHAGLNFNPLEEVDSRMWIIVYTPSDLRKAIVHRYCEERLSITERFAIAENTRKAFFMGSGNDEMRRFLPTK
ncbi:MAG: hypothetical protein ABFD51_13435 [Anaerolineaceae bacterium]|nr:hypothetical protein [Betaproteobacteria bacterium]